jgi:putative transposase
LGGAALQRCGSVLERSASAAEVFMAAPYRGNTGHGVYFITACTFQKENLFQSDGMAGLLVEVLLHYRAERKYLLHEFVVMPDHFHLLLTPVVTLERSVQFIKGGFSYRARKEGIFAGEIWEKSFYDRRVRNLAEYAAFRVYIQQNPVKRELVVSAGKYRYSSAGAELVLDEVPQRLKPVTLSA